LLGIFLWSCK